MITATVGLDISMNSSGLVFIINNPEKEKPIVKFIRICPTVEKNSPSAELIIYPRDYSADNYSTTDLSKVLSGQRLAAIIHKQIKRMKSIHKFEDLEARIEGSVMAGRFSKQSALNDLTVFNGMCKLMLIKSELVTNITVIPPKSLKKYATGNGNAKKGMIVEFFIKTFPDFVQEGKIDDIADAYFLAAAPVPEKLKYIKK